MNISKKAIMSFIVALTSVVAMAQPYYHIMKEENGKLIEQTGYDSKDYKIKIDMVKSENRPKDAIGNKITIESYDCDMSPLKRSFWFTKNGNVYYNNSEKKFYFEKSQIDYPSGTYSKDHCGHFLWARSIDECIDDTEKSNSLSWPNPTETDFYFANPENLPKLQEDLGNERWAVLSACEWAYVCRYLGEYGWYVGGKLCYLIDTTPNKRLLTSMGLKYRKSISKADFESYEAKGIVCLPASGYRADKYWDASGWVVDPYFVGQGSLGYYWSCTPFYYQGKLKSYYMNFESRYRAPVYQGDFRHFGDFRAYGFAVRLVILAND